MVETHRLSNLIATTLRREREARALTQQTLADRAGISQAAVTRIERGDRIPSIPMLERLFLALGAQLTVAVEPLDAHLDARLDELAGQPLAERIEDAGIDDAVDRLGDLPYVLTGGTAALLQGAPVPTDGLEVAIRWSDSAQFTHWLTDAYGQRWNEKWQEFGYLRLEPEEPGEHRWQTVVGEIRASMCDELPDFVEVRHGDRGYRVVPTIQVELTDPRAADLLRRYRQRQASHDDPTPQSGHDDPTPQAGHDDPTPRAGQGGRAEGTGSAG